MYILSNTFKLELLKQVKASLLIEFMEGKENYVGAPRRCHKRDGVRMGLVGRQGRCWALQAVG